MPFFGRGTIIEGRKKSKIRVIGNWISLIMPILLTGAGFLWGFFKSPDFLGMVDFVDFKQSIYFPLLISIIVAAVWIVYEYRHVNHRLTNSKEIEFNAVWSVFVAYVYIAVCFWLWGHYGSFYWFLFVPLCMSTLDGIASVLAGIDNAAQKPFLGGRDGTG